MSVQLWRIFLGDSQEKTDKNTSCIIGRKVLELELSMFSSELINHSLYCACIYSTSHTIPGRLKEFQHRFNHILGEHMQPVKKRDLILIRLQRNKAEKSVNRTRSAFVRSVCKACNQNTNANEQTRKRKWSGVRCLSWFDGFLPH